jgi:flagellar basal-body rod protein FlgC
MAAADLSTSLQISAAGMDVQVARIKVIAENLANQNTTGSSPGADAYRRRTISFQNSIDKALGVETVSVKSVGTDKSEQPLRYDPDNPAANKGGYVKTPNVNSFVELMDMRDAEQSYSANLNVASTTRTMLTRTLDLIK